MRSGAPHEDYTFDMKEHCETYVDYIPADPGDLREAVENLALASYRVLECRDGGRVDVRCDESGRPAFLELNPLPGLHPTHSDLPMIATAAGIPYRNLIGEIVDHALRRAEACHEVK